VFVLQIENRIRGYEADEKGHSHRKDCEMLDKQVDEMGMAGAGRGTQHYISMWL